MFCSPVGSPEIRYSTKSEVLKVKVLLLSLGKKSSNYRVNCFIKTAHRKLKK